MTPKQLEKIGVTAIGQIEGYTLGINKSDQLIMFAESPLDKGEIVMVGLIDGMRAAVRNFDKAIEKERNKRKKGKR